MKKVILIGRPNVGKSSLFNRLAKQRIAITSDISGTTRDTNKTEIFIDDKSCILIDSGGLDDSNEIFKNVKIKTLSEAANADIIVFMVDGKMLPDEQDKKIFYELLNLKKPTALVVNKVDSKKDEERSWEFNEFGSKEVFSLSVSHNIGTDELCSWIYKLLPETTIKADMSDDFDEFLEGFDEKGEIDIEKPSVDYETKNIKVGIIGRVNVGKSSLLNALVKEDRSVVSKIAGTTIDPVNESYVYEDRVFEFVDTAGIRKRGKIEGIERFALNRTEKILEESDIALLVLDSSEPLTELDERIAGLGAKFELGLIIVLNKWDKEHGDFDKVVFELRDKFKFLAYAPIISVSALGGKRVHKLYPLILEVYKNYTQKIKTSRLNEVIEEAVCTHPVPRDHGKIVKIYYGAQFGFAPPKIALVMNKPRSLHFSYKRYLLNKLRENFELNGTPVILIPKNRSQKESAENENR
ncbi:ribosome biogenesis GTPase Der [Campylobacter hyointestinalis]|uniref:ribosome biogenesis GTPase Der n=1 Tax=Campylobacter hyointestinalis TaxID=198 RepID=UPI000CE2EDB8|nr:ribosome biogenesis GTPase Der [Campylobacter hyointestinalis]PPB72742.1 ribosome biogenesis GTPase Der [Campylobacter hyointestinalis subsp. hyointestinalis]PPB74873.1 ribosome biogenesis GTPase Der [Campylobacter hyointestinalis subsp. hyointestinalis]PPB76785.1 ribosome biogenesis GTPase Der [Campylobacter hyointestinalis subsp. hyointestinalis]PPB77278.1 ribosome biogenesis GTPase Der [Campylobacter hyointestinalis subsp. hyointestinalis]